MYSRRIASEIRDWLTNHGCTGTVLAASSPEEAVETLPEAEILFGARFPTELFKDAPRLKWIQSINAGVEELVGDPAIPREVTITRIVGQFSGYIAEYVFAELLARARQIDRLRAAQRERHWEHFTAETLAGKTLGVAGLGSIGQEIVRKGRAFDMRVHGLSRTGAAAGIVDRHFASGEWFEFVSDLDVLVLTLPRTADTEGSVNERVLNAMRPDSVLVNVGRGALVDEDALVNALQRGRPAAAVLDVFREEPLPVESPLWSLPNVVVTPHVSGPSTVENVSTFFLENLNRYVRGEPLVGVVDREAGY